MEILNWIGEHPYIFIISLAIVCITVSECFAHVFNNKTVTMEDLIEGEDEAV